MCSDAGTAGAALSCLGAMLATRTPLKCIALALCEGTDNLLQLLLGRVGSGSTIDALAALGRAAEHYGLIMAGEPWPGIAFSLENSYRSDIPAVRAAALHVLEEILRACTPPGQRNDNDVE